MAKFIDPEKNHYRTTDHSAEITALREAGEDPQNPEYTYDLAAAALLEVHDDTGLSLDDWEPVRQFVNQRLLKRNLGEVLPNGC